MQATPSMKGLNFPVKSMNLIIANCRVPDDYLLHNRRSLLMGREALAGVLARWEKDPECC
jgi:hypothetical protein